MNFLSVQKRIKERSIISEQEITHYILLAINNTMINLKIAELLKNFTLSCNPKYHWHRQKKKVTSTSYSVSHVSSLHPKGLFF